MQCVRALVLNYSDLGDTVTKNVIRILFSTTDLIQLEEVVLAFVDNWRQGSDIDIPVNKKATTEQLEKAPTLDENQERLLTIIMNEYVDW